MSAAHLGRNNAAPRMNTPVADATVIKPYQDTLSGQWLLEVKLDGGRTLRGVRPLSQGDGAYSSGQTRLPAQGARGLITWPEHSKNMKRAFWMGGYDDYPFGLLRGHPEHSITLHPSFAGEALEETGDYSRRLPGGDRLTVGEFRDDERETPFALRLEQKIPSKHMSVDDFERNGNSDDPPRLTSFEREGPMQQAHLYRGENFGRRYGAYLKISPVIPRLLAWDWTDSVATTAYQHVRHDLGPKIFQHWENYANAIEGTAHSETRYKSPDTLLLARRGGGLGAVGDAPHKPLERKDKKRDSNFQVDHSSPTLERVAMPTLNDRALYRTPGILVLAERTLRASPEAALRQTDLLGIQALDHTTLKGRELAEATWNVSGKVARVRGTVRGGKVSEVTWEALGGAGVASYRTETVSAVAREAGQKYTIEAPLELHTHGQLARLEHQKVQVGENGFQAVALAELVKAELQSLSDRIEEVNGRVSTIFYFPGFAFAPPSGSPVSPGEVGSSVLEAQK